MHDDHSHAGVMHDLLPPDPEGLEPLHEREYLVRSFRVDDTTIVLRGAVRDTKPAGLYVRGDAEPLPIHHMVVDLTVSLTTMTITAAEVVFEVHPHSSCPGVIDHYGKLVGLSISRGFTHRVRELFGGPRGCTHTTALLQAMAPVAVQTLWSMRAVMARDAGSPMFTTGQVTREQREAFMAPNLNTCHVWDEDGAHVANLREGVSEGPPLWIRDRFAKLGRDIEEWNRNPL